MIVKCIAIDDEPLALRQIKSYIDKSEQLELVAACRSAKEAQKVIAETKVDLIFVDINMPDMNGLDFVRSLDTAHHIVFTTAHPEFAIDGFKLNAIDYLLKPLKELVDRDQYGTNAHTDKTELKIAELGNDAGIIGAALLGI